MNSPRRKAEGEGLITWEKFRKAFKNNFYPRSFFDVKRNELISLVQDDMTVTEYEKWFTELAKYALAFVVNEADKCKRFEEGLRTEIRALITISMDWSDFSKLVEVVMSVEKCMVEDKKNNFFKKDPCSQSFSSIRSGEDVMRSGVKR